MCTLYGIEDTSGPFHEHDLTLIPSWINNLMADKVWGAIIYPFPNLNGGTVEIREWSSNFTPYFIGHVITHPWWN